MKVIKFILVTITVFLVACSNDNSNSSNNTPNPLAYAQFLDVAYGTNLQQSYDIYLPEGRTNATKVIILINGGGWTTGDKSDMNAIKDMIRQDLPNYAIVNINYRLADENNQAYPMQINDITSVVNHLISHKSQYVISEDYGFIGVSAGAHLSLLWSYAFDPDHHSKMACSIVGPTNFTDPAYLNNTDPELQALLEVYGVNPTTAFLEEVSPYHQATASAPPTILFYGGQDPLVPVSQGTAMRDKLIELGVTNEFKLYPNGGHGWIGADLLDTWVRLSTFIQTNL
ncbi:MAG: alpha/beta hydrolase [Gelidibacter sp.]|nr:alpha/beta hydrolase [Gelidibacter sp.]